MWKRIRWMLLLTAAIGLSTWYFVRYEMTGPLLDSLKSGPATIESVPAPVHSKRKRLIPDRALRNLERRENLKSKNPYARPRHGNQVEFRVVDGVAIAYGDQILGRVAEGSDLEEGMYDAPRTQIWEKAEIPYQISPDLPRPERVEKAIEYLRQNTRLQFVPYDNQPNHYYDAIVFEPGTEHCYSYLGRVGGLQPIKLSNECDHQAILHELMHVLGFIHEQSRPDRDQFVEIVWENVQPEFRHQFALVPEVLYETEKDTLFDYHSVMLYEPNAFARQPELTTIRSKKVDRVQPVSYGLSAGDLARIANLYRF